MRLILSFICRYVGYTGKFCEVYHPPHGVYLFSPFPWQWRGFSDVIAFIFSSVFYLICVWSAVRCVMKKNAPNRNLVICLSIICICMVFVFGRGVTNVGTAVRHRDKVIAVFTVLWVVSSSAGGLRAWYK